ncbi:MAG TPA: hypothetical protein VK480_09670 [Solirubrobacterales bacterium]|nr:hypothetical protein [Solirubrobacterales bacterium]
MTRSSLARYSLWFLFLSTLLTGLPAALAPHFFYDHFPFAAEWVHLLPPYNEHLVTDVGELYLGFAVMFGWAAWTCQATLIRAVCSAWLVSATLHLIFHVAHLEDFGAGDAVGEIFSLAVLLVPAILALWATRDAEELAS